MSAFSLVCAGSAFADAENRSGQLEEIVVTAQKGASTVGFYLDDVRLTAPASSQNGKVVIDPNLHDLNRVEVLRGP